MADFGSDLKKIVNPAGSFYYNITPSAIIADKNITLPLLSANDTFTFNSFAQTISNKIIDASNVISSAGSLPSTVAQEDTVNIFSASQTFNSSLLKLRNPADTFSYTIVPAAIAADRNLNIPLITATDTLASLGLAQTFSANQTLGAGLISQGFVRFEGDISPTQLTADQTDYNPTNLATSSTIMLDADSSFRSIGGLQGGADGRMIILHNMSANTILLSDENTTLGQASSAANRFSFGGYDVPIFPKQAIQIFYDATNSRWRLSNGQLPIIPPLRYGWRESAELTGSQSVPFSAITAASGGTTTNIAGVARHHGARDFTLGTSTTGSGSFFPAAGNVIGPLGNSQYWRFDMLLKVTQLSNVTDRYSLRCGFIDSITAESVDGAYFRYSDNVNSGKWERVTRSNSTETATDTGSTVGSTNFTLLTVIVNPAGNNAQFFVDGTSVGANTTNIPTGAGRDVGYGMMFLKSAGTTDTAFLRLDTMELMTYTNTIRTI